MKLLLTSAGVKNESIRQALLELLDKPIADCHALASPRLATGIRMDRRPPRGVLSVAPSRAAQWSISGGNRWACWRAHGLAAHRPGPMDGLGAQRRHPVGHGGDAVFLAHWMRQSGLAALLPSLGDKVWMGLSAGSLAMTPRVGDAFVEMKPSITGDDKGLGIVDFSIFPHLDYPDFPENAMAHAERWAAGLGNPPYAIDD